MKRIVLPPRYRQHMHKTPIGWTAKTAFTEQQARRRAAREVGANAYQCPICEHWHIGHRP